MVDTLPLVLQLDIAGNPQRWITYEDSAYYYAKDLVGWSFGEAEMTLRGGVSRLTGQRSTLTMSTIIAVKGTINEKRLIANNKVPLNNRTLFRRDRNMCGYCGGSFTNANLTRDHILPQAKGGANEWMNVITSCGNCNKLKGCRTPEESRMQLLFVPYVPSKAEHLILQNRRVLSDQMEFLMKKVPKESRLHG